MDLRRQLLSIASCGLLLLSRQSTQGEKEACDLLTAADASTALEVTSLPGKRYMESDPKFCMWSHDPAASDSSRRIALVIVSPRAFQIAMHPAIATIKVETVAGIGDEAFYQLYPNASPFIWVRKGNSAISIRILTRLKPKPFTTEQEKSKEAALAKAAVARL